MTLQDRCDAYAAQYQKWPASIPYVRQEQGREVLYGIWVLGNDYRNRTPLYGSYPPGFLDRLWALFPDGFHPHRVLHVFSGALPAGPYRRCDIAARVDPPPELLCNVYDLPQAVEGHMGHFDFLIADPPYSAADSAQYATAGINRLKATRALAAVTRTAGYLAWLDVCWPQHTKRQWVTIGRIFIQRSTNHRVRLLSLFQRVDA